jgi:hypothetical protein
LRSGIIAHLSKINFSLPIKESKKGSFDQKAIAKTQGVQFFQAASAVPPNPLFSALHRATNNDSSAASTGLLK